MQAPPPACALPCRHQHDDLSCFSGMLSTGLPRRSQALHASHRHSPQAVEELLTEASRACACTTV